MTGIDRAVNGDLQLLRSRLGSAPPRRFSYQVNVEAEIMPTVDALLDETITTSEAARARRTDSDH